MRRARPAFAFPTPLGNSSSHLTALTAEVRYKSHAAARRIGSLTAHPLVGVPPRRAVVAVANVDVEHPLGHRFTEVPKREPCVLVGVELTSINGPEDEQTVERIFDLSSSLEELGQLSKTAGLEVVGTLTQSLPTANPATFIGSGKVAELRSTLQSTGSKTAIFDADLTPGQQRALENALSANGAVISVIDRTALILDIFAQHAATREGQLQVELALYQYRLPRLTRLWTHLERQSGAGGVGLRGPGETQLEVDRRLIAGRVAKLKRELDLVRAHRTRLRAARRRNVGFPVVALVGYTNAGKSTLLNAMTGARALAADALFATLDPTTRRARLEGLKMSPEVLVTDTVGFVQNLPTQLVAAFRATLEEVVEADLLIHVVDGSVPTEILEWQMSAVDSVIEEIGAGGKPTVVAVNKIDLISSQRVEELRTLFRDNWHHGVSMVSAHDGTGIADIGVMIEEALRQAMLHVEAIIPYTRGDLTSAIYRHGCVLTEEHEADGTRITARVPGTMWSRLREFMVKPEEEENVFHIGSSQTVTEDSEERMWTDLARNRHSPRSHIDLSPPYSIEK